MHYGSRWEGVDTEVALQRLIENLDGGLLEELGAAPPEVPQNVISVETVFLPKVRPTGLDELLDRRVTCRNFDSGTSLSKEHLAAVLYRAFGARAVHEHAPGLRVLKKGVPSAGGLHPTEAYLLVQRVEGLEPGLYHYHSVDHKLEVMRRISSGDVVQLARSFVGEQPYFVDAHAFVIPVTRFRRNFWKYRNHPKSYRAIILDVGHLSQTMYLAATELGMGAFITAAVNEVDIERAFGLDPLEEGPIAVCGIGHRATERTEIELDPLHAVWPAA
jgi:putative peptide maturation dehydrogenase